MTGIPELLVPAGGKAQLRAAVAAGADAVYLGGSSFNARAGADNFDDDELRRAIDYAHTYGVDIHAALNILLYDDEAGDALEFAAKLYKYGTDAVIVQDAGLASLIHEYLPKLPVHMSTQSTIYSAGGVREAERAGASRVVLARELSFPEIRKICIEKGETEIEIFAHGAICICLSGQCRMSAFIGGRSGNRGKCAQPCRMLYTMLKDGESVTEQGYQLSPKDMCLLGHIDEIAEAGVDSIKIEGRMKSAEYTAVVTSIYRKYLDAAACGEKIPDRQYDIDMLKLRQIYSRGSFTDAYFKGTNSREMMSGSSPKNQGIRTGRMKSYDKIRRHAVIELEDTLSNGDGIEIRDGLKSAGNIVTYIRDLKSGRLVKTAGEGMIVEAGDLRIDNGIPSAGSAVYKITDKELMREAGEIAEKHEKLVPVEFVLSGATGNCLTLTAGAAGIKCVVKSSELLQQAREHAPGADMLKTKLARTGGTPYVCTGAEIELKGSPFVPAAMINSLRREVLNELTKQRTDALHPSDGEEAEAECARFTEERREKFGRSIERSRYTVDDEAEERAAERAPGIELYFYDVPGAADRIAAAAAALSDLTEEQRNRISLAVPSVLLTGEKADSAVISAAASVNGVAEAVLPAVTHRLSDFEIDVLVTGLRQLHDRGIIRAVKVQNPSHVYCADKAGVPFSLDLNMNILNSVSVTYWADRGMISAAIAEEPGARDRFRFDWAGVPCSVTVYGRIPMMYTEHCPTGSILYDPWRAAGSCGRCCSVRHRYHYCREGAWALRDRAGAEFPVVSNDEFCSSVIYSPRPVDRISEAGSLAARGARVMRICVFDERTEDILRMIEQI